MLTPLAAELEYLKEEYRLLKQENEALYLHMIEVEKQALERQLMFTQLSNASFEGIVLYKENQIVLVNDAFYHLFGIEHRQLDKIRILDLVAPEHQKEALHQAEQTDKDWFETICVNKTARGFRQEFGANLSPTKALMRWSSSLAT